MFRPAFKSFHCIVLSAALALQTGAPAFPAQDPPPSKLNLLIIEGEGAVNNVRQRVSREPVVQVEDENRRPVAGAAVTFTLPGQGASGTFPNGARSLTVMTDADGRAVARGIQLNNSNGQMQIRVTASFRGLTASATITQTSGAVAAAGGMSAGKIALIVGAIGGAAAGIAVGVTRSGGSSTTTPTPPPAGPQATVISPGTPTVGPPR